MLAATVLDVPADPVPDDLDAAEHLARALARVPWHFDVEVLLDLPLDDARGRVAPTLAELDPEGAGTRLRMRADSLAWVARVLAGLGCALTVRRPDALRTELGALAARLADAARVPGPGAGSGPPA